MMNNKTFLYLGVVAVVLAAIFYYARSTVTQPVPVEQTSTEAAQEIEQAPTNQEAADTTIEKIDEEFSATSETEFNTGDLSDEALGL
ncbi:MAG: hypothetical protein UY13_C0002G0251 [Candidatus Pacebacteria bacterium GW2011_GWB1_47_8]|nr:MAG: hypothetical protein UX28_C0001G0399 [Candidatus Pacebacteria bacterium GW2011_GWA1_46_10]KKU84339.1 MAG: hypothetical protein UY13_C0002G0251 [Candidatus Pacebacteria bacterium GW2011_GWB1_47_8]